MPADRPPSIAGGIGITPFRSTVADLWARGGTRFDVVHLTRTPEDTASLAESASDGSVLHHSGSGGRFDLWPHLQHPDASARVHCCGPTALVEEVRALTVPCGRAASTSRTSRASTRSGFRVPFTAVWEPTRTRVDVPADRSLLDALIGAGVDVDSSCRSGTCGTCRPGWSPGERSTATSC